MTPEQEKAIYRLNLHKDIQVQDNCCIVNAKDIEIVLSMLEKKDKIIDLMAEMIVKVPDNSDSPQTATIIAMINRDLELRKIKVKQYFENKVKEVQ